jgi:hypothetical protein
MSSKTGKISVRPWGFIGKEIEDLRDSNYTQGSGHS